jgi:protein gp37
MTKIEWCDMTWNPVWGCLNNCPYCYARKIAKRFYKKIANKESFKSIKSMQLYNFIPIWIESNFDKKFPKKSKKIFVNSMSDISWWDSEWMKKVLDKIKQYPQHKFLFLTKQPEIYLYYNFPDNCWLGVTITSNDDFMYKNEKTFDFVLKKYSNLEYYNIFYSLEPMTDKIDIDLHVMPNWIIIGAETGNRKGKIIPKKEWIEDIRKFCQDNNIPYFEKNSIQEIVNRDLIQQFPEELI